MSVDGKKIAFISHRAGISQIFIREDNKDNLIYKNKERSDYLSAPLWKDQANLFVAIDGALMLLDIESLQVSPIKFDENKYILHLLSWDKKKLVSLAYRQNDKVFVATFNLESTTLKIIKQLKPQQAAHTFAGNKFVLIKPGGMFEIDEVNEDKLLVAPQVDNIDMSVGRKSGIYYQTQLNQEHTLWHISYPENEITQLFSIPENQLLVDISEDEQTALFRSIVHEKDIVVIKSNP